MSKSATHCTVSIADIHVPAERRGTDRETIERLANSIATLGLLSPILVRDGRNQVGEQGKRMILVAGQHRLEALKLLGREHAECLLLADDDLRAELAEIDENLCRSELSPAQIAAAISRRKQIYIALHPETAAGKSQAKAMNAKLGRGDVSEKCSPTFAVATAAASGMNRRTIEKAAARGEAITPEKLQKIAGTSLDKGGELDALAKMPIGQRDEVIAAAAGGEIVSARDLLKEKTPVATASQNESPPQRSWPPTYDAQLRSLEEAWNAASDPVRVAFGFEVLGLRTAAALSLPKQARRYEAAPDQTSDHGENSTAGAAVNP
jgi:ParB family chromosome partitioning protein